MNDFINNQIAQIEDRISETKKLLEDSSMANLAHEEIRKLEMQKASLFASLNHQSSVNKQTDKQTTGQQETDNRLQITDDCILEIRSAAGGDEAGLFATDLLRMYQKFAVQNNWKFEELDRTEGGIGNIKTVVAKITGKNVYEKLKYESGVHRVQRVPKTESSGRIHTSTATVAILPEISPTQLVINPKDIEFEAFRSGGHGGQNVNKVSTAVRIKHIPSGIIVKTQTERSQGQNREIAMQILRSKLYQMEEETRLSQLGNLRQSQVGTGDRSEKIRTYNFPQDRITDHRIKRSWGNIESVLNGNLNKIIENLHSNLQ